VVLPQLWDGFQVVGGDPALNTVTGAANAVVLGAVLLVATTVINSLGVKLMSHVNSVGVTCEIVGVAAVVLALISAAQRGPEVVADTTMLQNSELGAVGAFLVSGSAHHPFRTAHLRHRRGMHDHHRTHGCTKPRRRPPRR
jgi:amino acid transporter